MKRSALAALLVLSFALVISCGDKNVKKEPATNANTMHGQATGMAAVYDGDKGLARDRATDDACRKLVEQVLGNNVSSSSMVQDFQLVSSIVESSATGMVKNQKYLKDTVEGGDTYVVTIEGDVYPSAVGDAIKSTLENYGRPKFMILLKESFEGAVKEPGMTVSELSIMETMGNQGFQFVDASTVQSLMRQDRADMQKAMAGQIGGNEAVQSLLLQDNGAEVVIYGEVTTAAQQSAALQQYSKNMKSRQATINLKAVDVYTGNILATCTATAPSMHIDANTASINAVKACLGTKNVLGKTDDYGQFQAGNFVNQITRKFLESATRRPIQLSVAGLTNQESIKFRDFLSQRCRGVKKVEVKGQQGKEIKLEVLFSGKTVDLTDEFANKGAAAGFDISIVKSYPNKVQLIAKKTK